MVRTTLSQLQQEAQTILPFGTAARSRLPLLPLLVQKVPSNVGCQALLLQGQCGRSTRQAFWFWVLASSPLPVRDQGSCGPHACFSVRLSGPWTMPRKFWDDSGSENVDLASRTHAETNTMHFAWPPVRENRHVALTPPLSSLRLLIVLRVSRALLPTQVQGVSTVKRVGGLV